MPQLKLFNSDSIVWCCGNESWPLEWHHHSKANPLIIPHNHDCFPFNLSPPAPMFRYTFYQNENFGMQNVAFKVRMVIKGCLRVSRLKVSWIDVFYVRNGTDNRFFGLQDRCPKISWSIQKPSEVTWLAVATREVTTNKSQRLLRRKFQSPEPWCVRLSVSTHFGVGIFTQHEA